MQSTIKRCTLAIIMCGLSAIGMAQDILWQEDFSDFTIPQGWLYGEKSVDNWTIFYCNIMANSGNYSKLLWFNSEKQGENKNLGYAVTPELNYNGDIVLSFKYGKTSQSNSSLKITIQGNGKFADGNTETVVSIGTKYADGPTSVNCNVIGVNDETRIKFSLNSVNYCVIDDIVVTSDGITFDEEANSISDLQTAYNESTLKSRIVRPHQYITLV